MDINQIAKMAGVSRATVSRYLNDGYVSQEKRAAIKRVIDKTGYVPSRQAKTLRTGKTDVVGVIIPKINSASVSRMVAGITPVLNDTGYQVLLANTDNDARREVDFMRLFAERRQVDGVILIATVFTPEHLDAIKGLNVPVVILDQNLPGYSSVHQDDYDALRDITALVLKEARRPAYIGVFEEDVSAGEMRHRGFTDACAQAGVEVPDEAQVTAEFTVDSGYTCTESAGGATSTRRTPRPTRSCARPTRSPTGPSPTCASTGGACPRTSRSPASGTASSRRSSRRGSPPSTTITRPRGPRRRRCSSGS